MLGSIATDVATGELFCSFWQMDNNGLKLAALRFYQVPTTVQ